MKSSTQVTPASLTRKLAAALTLAGLIVLMLPTVAIAVPNVCPEAGKVESQVDGDLDNIVLDTGTKVCIKGGQVLVTVTADGTSTLADLLGTGQNVSHYTVLELPSTTTTTTEETTTTVEETTTTTNEETTTTEDTTTTTISIPETSTTNVETSTTISNEEETSTSLAPSTTAPKAPAAKVIEEDRETLPFTGVHSELLALVGLALLMSGGLVLVIDKHRA